MDSSYESLRKITGEEELSAEQSVGTLDSARSDDDDDGSTCKWRLVPAESVYDDGMLRILKWRATFERRGALGGSCNLFALMLLLTCNFALQMTVVMRVITLVDMGRKRALDRVFRPKGACLEVGADAFDFLNSNFSQQQDKYWFCGPYLPLVMSSVDVLDVNEDGKWSAEDDLSASEKKWISEFRAHGGRIDTVFGRIIQDIKRGNFQYQKQKGLSSDRTKELTNDFTSIPMSWMHAEQDVFKMCNALNKDLCGNLELRGSLKRLFTTPGFGPADRVGACRDTLDRCETIFGEVFRSYRLRARESCGSMASGWVAEHLVVVNRYDDAQNYDNHTNNKAITTSPYEIFLLLVLIIWWLSVITEVRSVMAWWMVLLTIPSNEGTVVKEEDEELEIVSVSWWHKFPILVFINLPRTIIICILAYIGTEFLIVADSYADLILNSVALGFLIEVDDMLFSAVTSESTKKSIEKLQSVKGKHWCCSFFVTLGKFPASIPYMILVASLAALQAYYAYIVPEGKFQLATAYRCLCHAEGNECIAAQLIGGDHYLDSKYC